MYAGKTLFAKLMDFLPWTTFARIVERYGGDRYVKSLRCAEHFRVMAFAQLTYRESLRDIEACLSAQASKLYHMGFREPIRRSTLSNANKGHRQLVWVGLAGCGILQCAPRILLPTHAADFGPDLESLAPGSSVLGSSDVIAAEVE